MHFILKCSVWGFFFLNLISAENNTDTDTSTKEESQSENMDCNNNKNPSDPKKLMREYREKLDMFYELQRSFEVKMKLQDTEIRRHYCVLYGLNEEMEENIEDKVFDFLSVHFPDCKIDRDLEIEEVMRIGRPSIRLQDEQEDHVNPRPVVIKFTTQLIVYELVQKSETVFKFIKYSILNFKDIDDAFDRKKLHDFISDHRLGKLHLIGKKVQYTDSKYYLLPELKHVVYRDKYGQSFNRAPQAERNPIDYHSYFRNPPSNDNYRKESNNYGYDHLIDRNRNQYRTDNYNRNFNSARNNRPQHTDEHFQPQNRRVPNYQSSNAAADENRNANINDINRFNDVGANRKVFNKKRGSEDDIYDDEKVGHELAGCIDKEPNLDQTVNNDYFDAPIDDDLDKL